MSTNRQIAANKQNASSSTGPKTAEGKAASSQNSFRHGLAGSAIRMLPSENIQDFLDLANGMIREHKPTTITEDALVTKMIQSLWLSRRALNLQQELLEQNSTDKQLFTLYLRYQTTHDRAFSKSLNDLITLRKEVRRREVGFVSQGQKTEIHQARLRAANVRIEAEEAVVEYRKMRNARYFAAAASDTRKLN